MAKHIVDAAVLARYGIPQEAIGTDRRNVQTLYGIRSEDSRGIVTASNPIEELDTPALSSLRDQACAAVGIPMPPRDDRSEEFTAIYLGMMSRKNAQRARVRLPVPHRENRRREEFTAIYLRMMSRTNAQRAH
jgi:hypothetical protein